MTILLDTTCLIDALRGRGGMREQLAELLQTGHSLLTSAVCVGEVYAGMRPEEESETDAFLKLLPCVDVTASIARQAGFMRSRLRRNGITVSLTDMLIAATAIASGCSLYTENRKDFPLAELRLYEPR